MKRKKNNLCSSNGTSNEVMYKREIWVSEKNEDEARFGWKMKKILNKVLIFEAEIEIKKKQVRESHGNIIKQ
jgi:hypothetical protein